MANIDGNNQDSDVENPLTGRRFASQEPTMLHERVTAIMDGQITPLPGLPVFSSAGSRWSGFLLEDHVISASRDEMGWSWHNTHVGVCTAGRSVIRVSGAAGDGRFLIRPGCVSIFPRGCDQTNIHHAGGGVEFVVVEIDHSRLERLFHDDARQVDNQVAPQCFIHDPRIAALLANMRAEVEAGCPSDSLYGESLSLALAAYVCSHYAAHAQDTQALNHRFSHVQIQRLLDYIHAHLGGDFSLVELASVVHLSPRHFSRLFRNTFGMTPHRYVVSERINQAKALLAASQLPIVEIATRMGFASQSHFTDVFRRAIGISPKRYQLVH